jgi:hypothetical protein
MPAIIMDNVCDRFYNPAALLPVFDSDTVRIDTSEKSIDKIITICRQNFRRQLVDKVRTSDCLERDFTVESILPHVEKIFDSIIYESDQILTRLHQDVYEGNTQKFLTAALAIYLDYETKKLIDEFHKLFSKGVGEYYNNRGPVDSAMNGVNSRITGGAKNSDCNTGGPSRGEDCKCCAAA